MKKILIIGAGKIGSAASELLSYSNANGSAGNYFVTLADIDPKVKEFRYAHQVKVLDVHDYQDLQKIVEKNDIVLSALSLGKNILVAEVARKCGASYYDLSEDVESAHRIETYTQSGLKPQQFFVPQCGLAPGFVSIIANHLSEYFDEVYDIGIRVGSLPQNPNNSLKYNLMWSVDGLINECANPCNVIRNWKHATVDPLAEYEELIIGDMLYEAFTTSGGIGSLCSTWSGKARNVDYKTIRYKGHLDKFRFLMKDLNLQNDRDTLKKILVKALPETHDDKVVILVSVTGVKDGRFQVKSKSFNILPTQGPNSMMTAIQATTAGSVCSVIDIMSYGAGATYGSSLSRGFVKQEDIIWNDFKNNRFAQWFLKDQA